MSEEDKEKLREFWDFMEEVQGNILSDGATNAIESIQVKFEQLFTKELND